MKLATRFFMGSTAAKLIRKTTLIAPSVDHLPVHTLTFSDPTDSLNVRMDMGDVVKVVVPGYKPKSYSMSDSRPGEFDITFKVYPNGRASGFLDRLKIGDEIEVFRKGHKERNPGKLVAIVAFGVGVTEGLPIAAAELAKGDAEHVHFIWASRTLADTFWMDKIEGLKGQYGSKFKFSLVLSREERESCRYGRLSPALLQSLLEESWGGLPYSRSDARFLTVGTKEMMREAEGMLQSLGYNLRRQLLLTH